MLCMFELKMILGIIAVIIGILGYVPYVRDIFRGKTKPHAYTWLTWSILTWIGFYGQVLNNGGAGAWVTGITAILSLFIFILALKWGEKNITFSDKLSLFGAFIAMFLWSFISNPLSALMLVIIIDAFGFFPTFRKSYHKPMEETVITFFVNGLKYVIALFALDSYSLMTYLYPVFLASAQWTLVAMLLVRRMQQKQQ